MEDKYVFDSHLCPIYMVLGTPILELNTLQIYRWRVYLPLLFATVMMTIMYLWNYGYRKKYIYELDNKVSPLKLAEIASDTSIHRSRVLHFFTLSLSKAFPNLHTLCCQCPSSALGSYLCLNQIPNHLHSAS